MDADERARRVYRKEHTDHRRVLARGIRSRNRAHLDRCGPRGHAAVFFMTGEVLEDDMPVLRWVCQRCPVPGGLVAWRPDLHEWESVEPEEGRE